jgi:hypothetical protein
MKNVECRMENEEAGGSAAVVSPFIIRHSSFDISVSRDPTDKEIRFEPRASATL